MWHSNVLIQYIYTATVSKFAYAMIEGVSGWRQIYPGTEDSVSNLLGLLSAAKASDQRVNVYVETLGDAEYITRAYFV